MKTYDTFEFIRNAINEGRIKDQWEFWGNVVKLKDVRAIERIEGQIKECEANPFLWKYYFGHTVTKTKLKEELGKKRENINGAYNFIDYRFALPYGEYL